MKKKIYFSVSMAMLVMVMLTSCKDDGTESEKYSVLSISRAEIQSLNSKNAFNQGDEIGIFVFDEAGGRYNDCPCSWNNKATLLDGGWKVDRDIYLTGESGTIRAYYPYDTEVLLPSQIPVRSASQTDYLYSRAISADAEHPVVTLQMQHALSLIKFVIRKDGSPGAGLVSGLSIQGISTEGTLDISTGEILVSKTGNESYKGSFTLGDEPLVIGIIALPQSVTSTTVLLMIDGERYGYKLPAGEWPQGKETTYTLGINTSGKKLFEVGGSSIDEWGTGGNYEGNLSSGIDIGTEILLTN